MSEPIVIVLDREDARFLALNFRSDINDTEEKYARLEKIRREILIQTGDIITPEGGK